jgi:ABC-2 type transport system permease protein
MRSIALAWAHFKIGAMNELQYRSNFFIQVIHSGIALATGLIAIILVFSHTQALEGWSRPELLAVMGIHIALGGVIRTWIQPNMQRILEDVREGNFDYVLAKPVDAQLLVSIRQFKIWHSVDLIIGGSVLGYALTQIGGSIGLAEAVAFAVVVTAGGVMIYCAYFIVITMSFRVISLEDVMDLFNGVYETGRWPVTIYPTWLRGMLTFLVPLAFAVTIPAETLSARVSLGVVGVAVAFCAVLLLITRLVWVTNLRKYAGASA